MRTGITINGPFPVCLCCIQKPLMLSRKGVNAARNRAEKNRLSFRRKKSVTTGGFRSDGFALRYIRVKS